MNVREHPRQPQCSRPSSPASESASPVVTRADVARPGNLGRRFDFELGCADFRGTNATSRAGTTARSVIDRMPSGSASARWNSGMTLLSLLRGMRLPTDEYHSICCESIFTCGLRRLRPCPCLGGSESAASIRSLKRRPTISACWHHRFDVQRTGPVSTPYQLVQPLFQVPTG